MPGHHLRISKHALRSLTGHARKGFGTPYKREVGGHLLGHRSKNGFYVSRAIPYNSRYSRRSGWGTVLYYFRKKGLALETERLKWIGTYHSHVEINRSASTGQSREDKEAQIFSDRPIEIIVRVTSRRMKLPETCISCSEVHDGRAYFFDICGYIKDPEGRIAMMTGEAIK